MADVTLTEAQLNARTNHYLEKIGQGKPKAKGTKSNPYKGKDLTKLLKERFNNKNNNAAGSKNTPITKLPEMVEAETKAAEKAASKQLTYGEAHQIQNNISEKSKNALTNLRDNLAAEEAKAEQKAIKKAPKAKAEPKTWTKYAEEHGTKYEQPVSGVVEADRRAAQAIKENQAKPKTWAKYAEKHGTKYVQPKYEAPKFPKSKSGINTAQEALKQEALANAEGINKPFTTSSAKIDKQLGMGHKNPVSPNYAEEYGKLLDEKGGVQKNNQPKTWAKYAEEHGTKYEQPVSGVVEADKRAAEAIKQNKAKPKTWADYAKKHGTKY